MGPEFCHTPPHSTTPFTWMVPEKKSLLSFSKLCEEQEEALISFASNLIPQALTELRLGGPHIVLDIKT